MADTTFITRVTTILSDWVQAVNDFLYKGRNPNYATTTGTSTAYILTLPVTAGVGSNGYTSAQNGDIFYFTPHITSGAAATLTVKNSGGSNVGPFTLQYNGVDIVAGDMKIGTVCHVVASGTTWQLLNPVISASVSGGANILLNPGFTYLQRLAASILANANDSYGIDCWYLLSNGNVDVVQQVAQENGQPNNVALSRVTGTKTAQAQIVESKSSTFYRGKQLTLSARALSAGNFVLRYAILEWTGTADSVTSDVVNNWASTTYTPGNFFLGSNLVVAGVGTTQLSSAWTAITPLTATISSVCNNLIVMFWLDGTVGVGQGFSLGSTKLEMGVTASPFVLPSQGDIIASCQRYLYSITSNTTNDILAHGFCTGTVVASFGIPLPVIPRVPFTSISLAGSTAADYAIFDPFTSANIVCSAVSLNRPGRNNANLSAGVASGLIGGNGAYLTVNGGTSRVLFLGAEL